MDFSASFGDRVNVYYTTCVFWIFMYKHFKVFFYLKNVRQNLLLENWSYLFHYKVFTLYF